ncbi:alpha-hydroxy-acid oxidizing protein [Pseudomonas sp. S31]|uniref:alpha-hydroxy acid oxidase n=1 Tax=Pseudomonas sp. S31 TaxID=1564473 RepID=UPI001913A7DD|nr:alpha-hydroxy acid oxidase [Pseudomonas sp. S31]MBK5000217.1 alpha-hydroxy-acid oxidizing protein [Pseudomonas sp. S31]
MLMNFFDYRLRARRRLPRFLFEYIDRGCEDEVALARLRQSLDRLTLRPAMLSGHATPDLGSELFGQACAMPVIIAPTAMAGLVAHDGEVKLARAAARAGIPLCISTQSISSVAQVRAAVPDANLWFQLYFWKDRSLTERLLDTVAGQGVETLVITVDTPAVPKREYNARNGLSMPMKPGLKLARDVLLRPGWLTTVLLRYLREGGMPCYGNYPPGFRTGAGKSPVHEAVKLDAALGWRDIEQVRQRWAGQLLIKGVLSVEDALRAQAAGAQGIVVSAHGGRNLDCSPMTAEVLPGICAAVGKQMCVIADSGVARGSDVLRYRALGAQAVMVGRLPLWGLACGGEAGADGILRMLREELELTLQLLGRADLEGLEAVLAQAGTQHDLSCC